MRTRCLLAITTTMFCAAAALLPVVAQEKGDLTKTEMAWLQDTWNYVFLEQDGTKKSGRIFAEGPQTITFQEGEFEVKRGNTLVQAGTQKLDPGKTPKTIDLNITEGEGKGTMRVGIYQLQGDTLKTCFDLQGKNRPAAFPTEPSAYLVAILQRERKPGVDPRDASIFYDTPFMMMSGFKTYNGKVYDKTALCVEPKSKLVVPDKNTVVEQHNQADMVLIFMEKQVSMGAHLPAPRMVNASDYREKMGCAVKLEKGVLLIGTFGEFGGIETAAIMKLLVLVPPKVEVEQRAGLIGTVGKGKDPATQINPKRAELKPTLAKSKEGMPNCWLPPTVEDGWHEIPAIADIERRVSKAEKK